LKDWSEITHWVDSQKEGMVALIIEWAAINSHTFNLKGIQQLAGEIASAFSIFNEEIQWIDVPPAERVNDRGEVEYIPLAPLLTLRKRPKAKKQVLLVCHMDTVFSQGDAFQEVVRGRYLLEGPGVADAKGGIVVMLKVLEALEQWWSGKDVGWQVVLNTDEEIGSPGSASFLMKTARRFDVGLVFEPCLPDGRLVGVRKGSGNFTLVVKGVSAHAGRHPEQGRNAIEAAAACVQKIAALNNNREGLTINFGQIQGGEALNVVPDLTVARFNARIKAPEDQGFVEEEVDRIIQEVARQHEVEVKLHGKFLARPKGMDQKTLELFKCVKKCGKELGLDVGWTESGGVCDGNRLAAAGLPTVDTLGVRGGGLHSHEEHMDIESLTEKVKLGIKVLMDVFDT